MKIFDDILKNGVKNHPEKTALFTPRGSLSYAELDRLSSGFAELLRKSGARLGDRVALCIKNPLRFMPAFFGAVRCGCVCVPVNGFLKEGSKRQIIDSANCRFVIGEQDGGTGAEFIPIRLAKPQKSDGVSPLSEKDTAVILFTSGSTATPKGVCLSQKAMLSNAKALTETFGEFHGEGLCLALPLFHSFGLQVALSYLYMGETVCIPETSDFEGINALCRLRRITDITTVPAVFGRLLSGDCRGFSKEIGFCIVGGARVEAKLTDELSERLKNARVLVGYGLTENSPVVSCLTVGKGPKGSVGKPINGVFAEISQSGEIEVGGSCVMNGYLNEKGEQIPLKDAKVKTGDLGHFENGFLFVDGRIKDIIIKGGESISAEKISAAALLCGASEAAAVSVPDSEYGENIALFAVPKSLSDFDIESFKARLSSRLTGLEMPKIIIPLAALPKTDLGKVDKAALKAVL